MRLRSLMLVAAVLASSFGPAASRAEAQAVVADLPVPSGGIERVAFLPAPSPRATVILLAGGEGIVRIDAGGATGNNNFLIRTRNMWAPYGINALALGSPDNHSLLGQRSQPGYAASLAVAIDFARSRSNVPVWLVGTSQGSIAAVTGAARLGGRVAGVVLSSSVTQPSRSGETVFDTGPNAVAVPALVIGNNRDTCRASPPSDAPSLLAAMAGSPRKEMVMFDSSDMQSSPCEALSPHGYLGIEPTVIARIAAWIGAAPGR